MYDEAIPIGMIFCLRCGKPSTTTDARCGSSSSHPLAVTESSVGRWQCAHTKHLDEVMGEYTRSLGSAVDVQLSSTLEAQQPNVHRKCFAQESLIVQRHGL